VLFFGLLKQITYPSSTYPYKHFNKVRTESEKNGTPASPATALAMRVLPVPEGLLKEPFRNFSSQLGKFGWVFEIINDFHDFLFASSKPATSLK
jgi:hypothetical protein